MVECRCYGIIYTLPLPFSEGGSVCGGTVRVPLHIERSGSTLGTESQVYTKQKLRRFRNSSLRKFRPFATSVHLRHADGGLPHRVAAPTAPSLHPPPAALGLVTRAARPVTRTNVNTKQKTSTKSSRSCFVLASTYLPGPLPAKYCQRK